LNLADNVIGVSLCPVCNESQFKVIGKPRVGHKADKVVKQDYKIVECNKCGFYYLSPKLELTSEEWQILYDLEYFTPINDWHLKRRKRDLKKRFNKMQSLTDHKEIKYLDVGAGEGFGLIEAVNRGWETYGIDITDHRIYEAKNIKIEFRQIDLINANFPDNHFNCIYVDSVLEHVPNPMELLNELNRILSPGGTIYIGVPNENSLFTIIQQIVFNVSGRAGESSRLKPFASPYHIGGFTRNSLKLAIQNSGLSIKQLRNFASKSDILCTKFLSRDFFISAFYLPISIVAYPLRMEIYFEAYLTK
jgi:SAM-dependent methyltransferase